MNNGKWKVTVNLQSRCCGMVMIIAMVTGLGVVMGREGRGVAMRERFWIEKTGQDRIEV